MFTWSLIVAAYWIVVFSISGNKRVIALTLAAIYSIHHLIIDFIFYSPGYIYFPSCIAVDLLCFIIIGKIKNNSYISNKYNDLLLLSALLNFAGYWIYLAELPNIVYDLSIVGLHSYILYLLLSKDDTNGCRNS